MYLFHRSTNIFLVKVDFISPSLCHGKCRYSINTKAIIVIHGANVTILILHKKEQ